ncbi:MAG TPA: sugar phosphate isomerase/epimerase [Chitinophagaceae bacterium]
MQATTRRDFIKHTSILTAGLVLPKYEFLKSNKKIGIQLYTLRELFKTDVPGTIAAVAQAGYQEVETYDYNNGKYSGLSAEDYRALLEKNQLVTPSGHYYLKGFLFQGNDDEWKVGIENAKKLGQQYMVVPYLDANERKTLDAYKKLAGRLNLAGEWCKKAGLQVAYHNHDFEFQPLEGSTGMEVLLKETDKSLVQFELDVYWVSFAGKNPFNIIKAHPGRFPLWHVKDMDNTPQKKFTEVGNGVIDFKKLFKMEKKAGMKHFFVEQDVSSEPLASIRTSIDYLKKNIL